VDPHGRSTVLDLPEAAKALITLGGSGVNDGDGVDLDEEREPGRRRRRLFGFRQDERVV
jgi:hypothetical protein